MTHRARRAPSRLVPYTPRLRCADRKSLLLGTALASTLLLGSLLVPSPARATVNCPPGTFPPPGPIAIINPGDDIVCVNVYDRSNNAGNVIDLRTNGANEFIYLNNSGVLTANNAGVAVGIYTQTTGATSPITILNSGDIDAISAGLLSTASGIQAIAFGANSSVSIENSGDFAVAGINAYGIAAATISGDSPLSIENSGDFTVTADTSPAVGIRALTSGLNSPISIENSGDFTVASGSAYAIRIQSIAYGGSSPVSIVNSGAIAATSTGDRADGIFAATEDVGSPIVIDNSGDITVIAGGASRGIDAFVFAPSTSRRNISLENSGAIEVISTEGSAQGIRTRIPSVLTDTVIEIVNQGDVSVTAAMNADDVYARVPGPISIINSGDIDASGAVARGIYAQTSYDSYAGPSRAIAIGNTGRISAGSGIRANTSGNATAEGGDAGIAIHNAGDILSSGVINAGAIYTATLGSAVGDHSNVGIAVDNSGDLTAVRGGIVAGVFGSALGAGSNAGVAIKNSGAINALYGIYTVTKGNASGARSNVGIDIGNSGAIKADATGILARVYGSANGSGSNAGTHIENSDSVIGGTGAGIYACNNNPIAIVNSGYVSAASLLAIQVNGAGNATIYNSGLITGFILLDADDSFNQNGGVFETKLTSDFGPGSDLFRNEEGGTVLAATNPKVSGYSSFVGLERFENQGLISLQDGAVGDVFRISEHGRRNRPRLRRLRSIGPCHRRLVRWARLHRRQFHHRRRCVGPDQGQGEQPQYRAWRVQQGRHPRRLREWGDAKGQRVLPRQSHRHGLLQLRSVLQADW